MSRAFTPRRVAGLEPMLVRLTDELLDAVVAKGEMDVDDDLAYPLPVSVIALLLDVPPADRARFKHGSDVIVANAGSGLVDESAPEAPEMTQAQAQFRAYFEQQLAARQQQPRDDLISALVALEAKIALTALLQRLPNPRRADDAPLEPVDAPATHGVKHLRDRFDPTPCCPEAMGQSRGAPAGDGGGRSVASAQ